MSVRSPVWLSNPPTDHRDVGPLTVTPSRPSNVLLPSGTLGLATILHCFPFQCSMRVTRFRPSGVFACPTAQTSLVLMAATALSRFRKGLGLGTATMLQVFPFQWRASGCRNEPIFAEAKLPTIQASLAAGAATPEMSCCEEEKLAPGVMLHCVPLKCKAMFVVSPASVPTAQISVALRAGIASTTIPMLGALGNSDQAVPFPG